MISSFVTQYLPPILAVVIVILAFTLIVAMLARGGSRGAQVLWRGIVQQKVAALFFCGVLLFVVAFVTFLVHSHTNQDIINHEVLDEDTPSNLLSTSFLPVVPITHTIMPVPPPALSSAASSGNSRASTMLAPKTLVATNIIIVQPGASYRFSVFASSAVGNSGGTAQIREVWLGPSLNLVAYKDDPAWNVDPRPSTLPAGASNSAGFHTEVYTAPPGATRVQIEVRNAGNTALQISGMKFSPQGVYVEPHPNGTQGAVAFSFDWESAMGGPVHSQGMEGHDVSGAVQHGLLMRQGANRLNNLFVNHKIQATFYATGYDLLDGNTEHRVFSGNPVYKWAAPKNNWNSDYWLTHGWFSDDPFGTYQTDPAWYFGDQTRTLLAAGHEIATHTFGHLYVRGSNPTELGTDLDEWLKAANAQGVPAPTTFAFPWRSSNSLTPDFYGVLYSRGIRAVTRLYAPDLRDLYTISAAPVYSYMAVMPDFLLGAASSSAGEEASGAPIGLVQAQEVLTETLARRGTTSFWNHPEQLGDAPELKPVRDTWTSVIEDAAHERDAGRLWIATVADITAYQREVMSVTVILSKTSSAAWDMIIDNESGVNIKGVTLTLPGEAARLEASDLEIHTVIHPTPGETRLSPAGEPAYPSRQVVIADLKPGNATVQIEWVAGREPVP